MDRFTKTIAERTPLTYNEMKRIYIICGHYGSGKTEFSLNFAWKLAKRKEEVALIDLDIANVYFRSRELRQLFKSKGIEVFGSAFDHEITAELPALSSNIRKPLESKGFHSVVDLGGDQSGAIIINQFKKYVTPNNHEMFCVVNANRPETETIEGALRHMANIEDATGLNITGIVNNTHMLSQTRITDIQRGSALCSDISNHLNIPIVYNCYPEDILETDRLSSDIKNAFPMRLFMRPSWLDR